MKILMPSSLRDIKLQQYVDYLKELEKSKLVPNQEEYINLKSMEIFCNLSHNDVMNIEYGVVTTITDRLKDILSKEPKRVESFKIENIEFGWLPKLDDMPYGEFLDLNNNISDWDTMVVAMGVLYRPITKKRKGKYLVEKYKGDTYHDSLMQMPMDAVIGAMVFFWNLGLDCLNYMMSSLDKDKQMTFQNQLTLVNAGVGTQHSMNLLAETLQSMKK
jgi:hypothetical protein